MLWKVIKIPWAILVMEFFSGIVANIKPKTASANWRKYEELTKKITGWKDLISYFPLKGLENIQLNCCLYVRKNKDLQVFL